MRFVPIKTPEQQALLMVHRTRKLLVRQRIALVNAMRAHLAEFGIVAGVGRNGVDRLLKLIEAGDDDRVPEPARDSLLALRGQLTLARQQIADADKRILACHRENELSQRLEEIPGVGPLIATALVASVPDPHVFKSARDLPAWIGLVPKEGSTGGKERPGHISKAGDKYLRSLLMIGAFSLIKRVKLGGGTRRVWLLELMARRPIKVAAIALANKIARIAWALMTKGTRYREPMPQEA
jgi:transposase